MKKLLGISVCAFILILTGCGKSNKLECSLKDDEMKTEVTMFFSDNKLSNADIVYSFNDEETAKLYYMFFSIDDSEKVDAKIKGKKITIKADAKQFTDDFSVKKTASKEDLKKSMTEKGFSCK